MFGKVVTGQELITTIEDTPVDKKARPVEEILISECGELEPEQTSDSDSDHKSRKREHKKKKKKEKKHKKHKKEKE